MAPHIQVFKFLALATLLAGVALAQTPAPTVVRWQDSTPYSKWEVRQGHTVFTLNQGGLSVDVWLDYSFAEAPVVAHLTLRNDTSSRLEFVPSLVTLALIAPKSEPFPYIPPEEMQRWFNKTGAGSGVFRENTLLPGKSLIGEVDFNWPKHFWHDTKNKTAEFDLSVPVGNYIFVFPYWLMSKK